MGKRIFGAGVDPGGLRDRDEIKIMFCYIFSKNKESLTKESVILAMLSIRIANYFDINDVFSELVNGEYIKRDESFPEKFKISNKGYEIFEQFEQNLPSSVKERILNEVKIFHEIFKNKKENESKITKITHGYEVSCSISGGEIELMKVNLYAPGLPQALGIRENFYKNPEKIYELILSNLAFDKL
jgi:predicted transcriptional regulator